jgi:hypothetical protein
MVAARLSRLSATSSGSRIDIEVEMKDHLLQFQSSMYLNVSQVSLYIFKYTQIYARNCRTATGIRPNSHSRCCYLGWPMAGYSSFQKAAPHPQLPALGPRPPARQDAAVLQGQFGFRLPLLFWPLALYYEAWQLSPSIWRGALRQNIEIYFGLIILICAIFHLFHENSPLSRILILLIRD